MSCKETRAFVDRIEGTIAVLRADGATIELPAAMLPEGAGEGTWVAISIAPIAVPEEAAAGETLRAKLGADDDGGDFKL